MRTGIAGGIVLALGVGIATLAAGKMAAVRSAPASPGHLTTEQAETIVRAQLDAAETNEQADRPEIVVSVLRDALRPEIFRALSPATQYRIAVLEAHAQLRLGDDVAAYRAVLVASNSKDATATDWFERLQLARRTGRDADAFVAFRHVAKTAPKLLLNLKLASIEELATAFGKLEAEPDARTVFYRALATTGWHPSDALDDASPVWFAIALTLAESGKADAAYAVAARITDPVTVIRMRADRRFDAVLARGTLDPQKAALARIAQVKAIVADSPDRLLARIALARAYHAAGFDRQALKELNEAVPPGREYCMQMRARYFDFCDTIAYFLITRSDVQLALGEVDAGLASAREALAAPYGNDLGTALWAAWHLDIFGQSRDALAILAIPFRAKNGGDLSVSREAIQICALMHLGREAEAKSRVHALASKRSRDPESVEVAQLCSDDEDGAAATEIAMLKSPEHRPQALEDLQIYTGKAGLGPVGKIIRARANAIPGRKDVLAALAPVGRSLTYDRPRP